MIYELPPVLSGPPQQQIAALRDYLVRMAQSLQTAQDLTEKRTASGISRAKTAAAADAARQAASLKSLIVKTAGVIRSSIEELETELHSSYVAESEFGEYREYAEGRFTQTASDITEAFDRSAQIRTDLLDFRSSVQGEIRRGLIEDPETGEENIGIAISRKLYFETNGIPYVDTMGNIYPRLLPAQSFGLYTATGWQYWINGQKVGWFDSLDSSLHLRTVTVNESISIGDSWKIMQHPGGGFGVRYVG
jgi:hypothetical protein